MNRYTFHIPCTEVWTVFCEAETENEAWEKIRHRDYYKLYTSEGTTPSGKTELVGVLENPGSIKRKKGEQHGQTT
jgi:hypothetical protein